MRIKQDAMWVFHDRKLYPFQVLGNMFGEAGTNKCDFRGVLNTGFQFRNMYVELKLHVA